MRDCLSSIGAALCVVLANFGVSAAENVVKSFGAWNVVITKSAFDGDDAVLNYQAKDVYVEIQCAKDNEYRFLLQAGQTYVAAMQGGEMAEVAYIVESSGKPVKEQWTFLPTRPQGTVLKAKASDMISAMNFEKGNLEMKIGMGDYTIPLAQFSKASDLFKRTCNHNRK